jgi:hypothetical protein
MVTVRYPVWHCASCNQRMELATHPTDDTAVPEEGDASVCIRCGHPHLLKAGRWAGITDDELIGLSLEDKKVISHMQVLVRDFNRWRKK